MKKELGAISQQAFPKIFPMTLMGLVTNMAMGAGYYLPNQDAFATAKGNAFVATADNASAVFYNPAGMTQLEEPQAQIGFYSIILGNEANVMGQSVDANTELQVAPSLYYVRPHNDRLSYGFSLNSPFGLGTDWGRDTSFSSVVTEARLTYLSATSAVGFKLTDELSIGASISANYADLTLEQGSGIPNQFLRFEGDDVGLSAAVSLRWQPAPKHAFGLVYATASTFDLEGETISNFVPGDRGAEIDFQTPSRIAGGYSYRPAPGWNIEANIEWLNWDSLDSLTLESPNVLGPTEVPFNWQSSFIYEIGASYITPEGYVFAVGYDFNANSQPDRDFTPGVSDADRHWFNLGFGRKSESYNWMLAYQFGYSNRTVDGASNPLANGKYKSRHNALVLSLQKNF
ncbi:OmpP1/FadL family transporter [Luteolibacter algae]|uniref:OmpP1/FadL family transporter n=1 Tax=Luteolibacter algae TaxID=454151 RepID=A0ABW5D6G3_9BACT